MEDTNSLFERIGGADSVDVAVDIFFKKVLADDDIKHFFASSNMKNQGRKLKAFLAYAFGSPKGYKGKKIRAAHASLNLTEAHFDAMLGHLIDTMKDLNVPNQLIDEVIVIITNSADDVLGR
tara:strand:- start:493 stop:858 length:366 start_codon:yes stop_codon:yes gene_type:complete